MQSYVNKNQRRQHHSAFLKRYDSQPKKICGSVVGLDDFAFKKRYTYGTIIVDEKTHTSIALLDRRDNKH